MIRFLLLHRIECTDRHPGVMLVLLLVVICIAMSLAPGAPQ